MFLHIGQEHSILFKDIIAIINLETRNNSECTNEFLNKVEEEGHMVKLSDDPDSFILTNDKVYLSPISAATLRKRVKKFLK